MSDFQLPKLAEPDCEIYGQVYWTDDHDGMSEDMVDVRLPNGILVSAGWSSVDNKYVITVCLQGRLIIPPWYTESAIEAQESIVERIKGYRGRNFSVSNSDDTTYLDVRKNTATGSYAVA